MTGIVTKEMTLRRQLTKHGVKINDVRWILHTHHHIDHAGQDSQFSMRQTVVTNRRELEYSASGIMGGQYPAEYVKHHIDRLHKPGAMRLLDLELSGPDEIAPGIVCEAAGGHTEGSMNILVETAEGHGLHLRRCRVRHPEPGRSTRSTRCSIYEPQSTGKPGHVEAPGARGDQEGPEQRHVPAPDPRLPGPHRARPCRVATRRRLRAGTGARRRAPDDRRDAEDGPRPGGVRPSSRALSHRQPDPAASARSNKLAPVTTVGHLQAPGAAGGREHRGVDHLSRGDPHRAAGCDARG